MWKVESENIVKSQESYRLYFQRKRKQGKNLMSKGRVHARKHAFLIIGLLVEEQKSLRILGHRLVFMGFWMPSLQGWRTPRKNLNENGSMLVACPSFHESMYILSGRMFSQLRIQRTPRDKLPGNISSH